MIGFYDYTVVVTYIIHISVLFHPYWVCFVRLMGGLRWQYPVWLFPDCVICLMER